MNQNRAFIPYLEIIKHPDIIKVKKYFLEIIGNVTEENVIIMANYLAVFPEEFRDRYLELAALHFLHLLKQKAEANAIFSFKNYVKLITNIQEEEQSLKFILIPPGAAILFDIQNLIFDNIKSLLYHFGKLENIRLIKPNEF